MANTYANILVFIAITITYYYFKPGPTIQEPLDQKKSQTMLGIYFIIVVLSQFFINIFVIIDKCGDGSWKNIGYAFAITFLPWTFMFGGIIMVLTLFPGFKSAFSNVVGYFVVSGSANKILTTLLIQPELEDKFENLSQEGQQGQKSVENSMRLLADALTKLCGNMSIMINQMVPDNFDDYWILLKPLMKKEYQNEANTDEIKQELLDLVVKRDNIGEGFWYGWTAILLTSVVQYNISSRACIKDPAKMQEDYEKFLEQEEKLKDAKEKTSQTYTLTT